MNRIVVLLALVLLVNCAHGDDIPQSPYDPELVEAAKEAVASYGEEEQGLGQEELLTAGPAECHLGAGGCKAGFICWDSLQCGTASQKQCSAVGDKRCHKRCRAHSDCPADMPVCAEKAIFSGGQHGRLETFCVSQ